MKWILILLLAVTKLSAQSVVSSEFTMYRDDVVIAYHTMQTNIELTTEHVIIDKYKLKITSKPCTFTGDDGYMLSFSCGKYEAFAYYTLDKYLYKIQIMYNEKLLEFKVNSFVI